ncbi:MAG: acetylxylan esterase [Planctomycetaceae bacterium]|nr:acetylxylan esterase [Planctomycetaceae bacterium]
MLRVLCLLLALTSTLAAADFNAEPHLKQPIVGEQLPLEEVIAYCEQRVKPVPQFTSVEQWQAFEQATREKTLTNVVFRGAAATWRGYKGKVEWLDTTAGGDGYKLKKLRYEALPGMWIPAVLYEPEQLTAKAPVFLNVNGHDGAGKVADYKQIRCINQAKRGIISLNLEWVGMGQLRGEGFGHTKMNQLDLCGTSGVAPHFLAMHRALDILLEHPQADPTRVGVAGLSGGGWQTIFISALDPRVTLTNPVAGYSSFATRARYPSDLGDSEQTPTDLGLHADYAVLTAMLAPRHALLTSNAHDQCCFAAPHALPPLLDAARPIYRLFGRELNLRSHVNYVPGDHNFGQDNREALYRLIGDAFFPGDKRYVRHEIDCKAELKSKDELFVPLPEVNEDFNSLALKLVANLPRTDVQSTRDDLRSIVGAKDYQIRGTADGMEQADGVSVTRWRLRVDQLWTLPAVEFAPAKPQGTVILVADTGRATTADVVQEQLQQGQRVIAVDPYYFGESRLGRRDWLYSLLIATVGDRPLGIQASQLTATARWARETFDTQDVRLLSIGPRTSVSARVAGAIEPGVFRTVTTRNGLATLKGLVRENKSVIETPELFCFGLLERFDLPQIEALAMPAK